MKLSQEEMDAALRGLPDWSREGEAITREIVFPEFADAIAFVTRLAFAAEAADHHPDLHISYRRVRLTWTTHSEKGLTSKDVDGARRSDEIARAFGGRARA
jgi:4a-hydroxytetrahydrobiopterin dehydratase